jgi:hypothetical protein
MTGRCDSCRHFCDDGITQEEADRYGWKDVKIGLVGHGSCVLLNNGTPVVSVEDTGTAYGISPSLEIHKPAEFGCVLWEERI